MAEASEESTHIVQQTPHRLLSRGHASLPQPSAKEKDPLLYHELSAGESTLSQLLARIFQTKPSLVSVVKPGDYRVEDALRDTVEESGAVWKSERTNIFFAPRLNLQSMQRQKIPADGIFLPEMPGSTTY